MATLPPPAAGRSDAVARVPRTLAFRHDILPLSVAEGILTVAVPDPADDIVLDALRAATRLRIRPVEMPREHVRERLAAAYGVADSGSAEAGAPAVRAVDAVLAAAIAAHASDVHVEPHATGAAVRFRVDGILGAVAPVSTDLVPAFLSRLKLLAGMDIADRRAPQDGRFSIPFEGRSVDARVSSVPAHYGEKLVVRLLDRYGAVPELGGLGMDADLLARFRTAIGVPWGFIVVAGPTGSGKTTTLYAALAALDVATRSVCSVEDPIEIRIPGVTQVQTNVRAGLTFPSVLRAFMRQDPNAIMIGEMRDAETTAAAMSAALAGQLVCATLHANDAPRAVDRLIELGAHRSAVSSALTAVLAQRLVRVLCERCRVAETIPAGVRTALETAQTSWFQAAGCRACSGAGFSGRTGVYELLLVDDPLRDAIAGGASSVTLAAQAARNGFAPMAQHARRLVLDGVTSFDEMRRVVPWTAA